jgi:hypothetical protein
VGGRERERNHRHVVLIRERADPAGVRLASRLPAMRRHPEASSRRAVPLTEAQWPPAILRRGPFPDLTAEEERRSTESLLAVTLATRGAARIH